VLIPRPETELLVELALSIFRVPRAQRSALSLGLSPDVGAIRESPHTAVPIRRAFSGGSRTAPTAKMSEPEKIDRPPRGEKLEREENLPAICDVGTGSGCIAVALACELPQAEVWALDVSTRALAVAETNARRHGVAERIRFVESDLFAAVAGRRFDMVVFNPPYLSEDDRCGLQPEVAYEPRVALDGGQSGLEIIRRFLAGARSALREDGCLLMEIGATQGADVAALARRAGFADLSVRPDAAGLPRVLAGR
jgi:release factor glutamine methyltransferase